MVKMISILGNWLATHVKSPAAGLICLYFSFTKLERMR